MRNHKVLIAKYDYGRRASARTPDKLLLVVLNVLDVYHLMTDFNVGDGMVRREVHASASLSEHDLQRYIQWVVKFPFLYVVNFYTAPPRRRDGRLVHRPNGLRSGKSAKEATCCATACRAEKGLSKRAIVARREREL